MRRILLMTLLLHIASPKFSRHELSEYVLPAVFGVRRMGHKRTTAHVPSMRPLYHTSHRPSFVHVIPRPIPPHNLKRVSRTNRGAIVRQLLQTLREDELAALSRAEICERLPRVRGSACTDGAPRARPCTCGSSLRADSGAASGPVLVFTVVVAIVASEEMGQVLH